MFRLWRCGPHGSQLSDPRCASRVASERCQFIKRRCLTDKGAAQVLTVSVIGGVRIADALVNTGSAFSMLSTAKYGRIQNARPIQPFTGSAPDIIGVGGATAEIRGYVDAPIEIDNPAVRHPLLVVEGLVFPLLLGTDILRPYGAMLTLDVSAPLRLRTCVCDICSEQRTDQLVEPPSALLTACATRKLSSNLARLHLSDYKFPTRCVMFPTLLSSLSRLYSKIKAAPCSL